MSEVTANGAMINNVVGNSYDDDEEYGVTRSQFREHEKLYKETIQMSEAALRLHSNPDFKKIIVDLYLTTEPARLAGMFAAKLPPGEHEQVANEIMGIGKLKLFLSRMVQAGPKAQADLDALNAEIGSYGFAGDE